MRTTVELSAVFNFPTREDKLMGKARPEQYRVTKWFETSGFYFPTDYDLKRLLRDVAFVAPTQYNRHSSGASQAADLMVDYAQSELYQPNINKRPLHVLIRGEIPGGAQLPVPYRDLLFEFSSLGGTRGMTVRIGREGKNGEASVDDELESTLSRYTGRCRLASAGTVHVRARPRGGQLTLSLEPIFAHLKYLFSAIGDLLLTPKQLAFRIAERDYGERNKTWALVQKSSCQILAYAPERLWAYAPWTVCEGTVTGKDRTRSRRGEDVWPGLDFFVLPGDALGLPADRKAYDPSVGWFTDDPAEVANIAHWTEALFQTLRGLEMPPIDVEAIDVPTADAEEKNSQQAAD